MLRAARKCTQIFTENAYDNMAAFTSIFNVHLCEWFSNQCTSFSFHINAYLSKINALLNVIREILDTEYHSQCKLTMKLVN